MKTRIVLVSSPLSLAERYGKFSSAASTEPSFGLACLAAVARRAGANVTIIEASAQNLSIEETLRKVIRRKPHIVGMTSTTAGIAAAGKLAQRIKKVRSGTYCIIGGCHVTALPEETLNEFQGFDMVVTGEGERTLEEIIQSYQYNKELPALIDGTVVRENKKIIKNKPRARIRNLDELPLPAWSLFDGFPEAFRPSQARIRRWPCASIVLTRGCPNECLFCDRSVFGRVCRAYSPSYAIRMIKDLRYNFGVKEILIEDDTFIVSRARVAEFCDRIISEKVDITWSCLGRADHVTPQLLKLMKKAGCWHISFGIESGDQDILRAMKKKLDIEQIRQALCWSKAAGLRTKGFFMVGFPSETRQSLQTTRQLAKSLALDDISVMQLTPFPGSELYKVTEQYGTFDQNWQRMNMLNTVFVPAGLSEKDIEAAVGKMIREFYLRPAVIMNQLLHVCKNPRLALTILRGLPDFIKIVIEAR